MRMELLADNKEQVTEAISVWCHAVSLWGGAREDGTPGRVQEAFPACS